MHGMMTRLLPSCHFSRHVLDLRSKRPLTSHLLRYLEGKCEQCPDLKRPTTLQPTAGILACSCAVFILTICTLDVHLKAFHWKASQTPAGILDSLPNLSPDARAALEAAMVLHLIVLLPCCFCCVRQPLHQLHNTSSC